MRLFAFIVGIALLYGLYKAVAPEQRSSPVEETAADYAACRNRFSADEEDKVRACAMQRTILKMQDWDNHRMRELRR